MKDLFIPFFLNDDFIYGMTKEERKQYYKTDKYLDEPMKISPFLFYLAFCYNYHNNSYFL